MPLKINGEDWPDGYPLKVNGSDVPYIKVNGIEVWRGLAAPNPATNFRIIPTLEPRSARIYFDTPPSNPVALIGLYYPAGILEQNVVNGQLLTNLVSGTYPFHLDSGNQYGHAQSNTYTATIK